MFHNNQVNVPILIEYLNNIKSKIEYLEEELIKFNQEKEYNKYKLSEEEKVELPKLMKRFYNMMDAKGIIYPYNKIPDDYCLKVKHLLNITHKNPNKRKSYDVLEPQCYHKVTELNYDHDMLGYEVGSEDNPKSGIGLFYTTSDLDPENIPGSGSGYDIWYLADKRLYNFFMEKLEPSFT